MAERNVTEQKVKEFQKHLIREEKSKATIEKYLRDIRIFLEFMDNCEISKEKTIAYKEKLAEHYAPASVNSMLAAMNSFLHFLDLPKCCVKLLKIQRQIFSSEEKELTCQEYRRLVNAAKGKRLSYVLQTICGTGIRVSELQYITVEAVANGRAVVNCKNKTRIIFIPVQLQNLLKIYIKKSGVKSGSVFVSKNGKALNRTNIWRDMKALCAKAGVSSEKVFPHNLRHLFARTFYSLEKDIVRLADLLGHSSINTTRIYTVESGQEHINRMERVQKILIT